MRVHKLLRARRPINRPMRWLFVLTVSLLAAEGAEAVDCQYLLRPVSGSTYEVTADTFTTIRKLQPEFFGFNIEWVEFQLSLWDSATQRVKPDAVEFLKALPGAVYRYPGGTVSNYFEWRNAIGDVRLRKAQSAVPWTGPPLVVQFGLVEYLKFVQSVGGRPWYVLNLYGSQAVNGNELYVAGAAPWTPATIGLAWRFSTSG